MNWKKPGARVIFALFVLCLAVDIFTSAGEQVAPDSVGRAVCKLRLLGFFAWRLFPGELSRYVERSYASFPDQAAISIIALALKVALVLVGLLAAILITTAVVLRPRDSSPDNAGAALPSEQTNPDNAGANTGWAAPLLVFVGPAALGWWFLSFKSPDEFGGTPLAKVLEDGLLFGSFGAGILLWAAFHDTMVLPILRRWFPDKGWMRSE